MAAPLQGKLIPFHVLKHVSWYNNVLEFNSKAAGPWENTLATLLNSTSNDYVFKVGVFLLFLQFL